MFGRESKKEKTETEGFDRERIEALQAKARAEIVADRKAGKYGGVIIGMSSDEKQEFDRKKDEKIRVQDKKKKADYIDEKSKLTEKQLLAEIILLLENIRNDAKINSETMNQKLNTISSATLDSKYELEAQTQADKKHRKDNTGPSWEF